MSASLTNRCISAEDLITAIDMGVKGSLLISEGVTFIDRTELRVSGRALPGNTEDHHLL